MLGDESSFGYWSTCIPLTSSNIIYNCFILHFVACSVFGFHEQWMEDIFGFCIDFDETEAGRVRPRRKGNLK